MSNLAYIDELGISEDQAINDTEVEANDTEEIQEDLNSDSEDSSSDKDTKSDTEADSDLLRSLQKQIEGMEKRIADKDAYINELREASKQKEAEKQQVDTNEDEEDDFWDNPEEKYKSLKEQMRIQQMQIQETIYANTVENYWKTVNPEALRSAVATDPEFADKFNKSREPYRVAYEYLIEKTKSTSKAQEDAINAAVEARLKEMGVKPKEKKEVPPTINSSGGKSQTSSKADAPDDGFAAVFGSRY